MFCTSCGVKNAADSNFCKQCGGKLAKAMPKISEDAFDRALPDEEQTAALLERAYRLRRAGDLDAAIALCEESLRLREDSTSAHSLLGQLHEEKGDAAQAIHEYERVLALNPGSIADRVKLDELKAREESVASGIPGAVTSGAARKPPLRVRLGDHRDASGFDYSRFTSAGVAVVLVGLGSLLALQFHPRSQNASVLPAAAPSGPIGANNMTSNMPSAPDRGAQTTQIAPDAPTAANGMNTPGKNAASVSTNPIPAGPVQIASSAGATLPAPPTAPTIIYQRGPAEIRYIPVPARTAPLNIAPNSALTRLPGKNGRPGRAPAGGNDTDRVVLDPDVTENGGKITVQVGDSDMRDKINTARPNDASGKTSGRGSSGRGADNDARVPGETEHIEMEKPHNGTARAASNPSSVEARSLVAMGEDKKHNKDYRGAVEAFGRALGSAGDQSGYIYQQRALCYQYLNDTSSARADYTHAIDEYRKLESRDPETARNGIRACQSGIKTCGE